MFGVDPEEIDAGEAVRDMLAEVGNFIGGQLKSAFTDAGLSCDLSTPSFATGSEFEVEARNMETYEPFAFKSGESVVCVELGIKISEPAQMSGQQGKDIHYPANGAGEPEQGTSNAPAATAQQDISPPEPAAPQDSSPPAGQAAKTHADVDLDLLLDIPLEIKVELGRTKIDIQELLNLVPGSAVKLSKLEGEPVDILANDTLIAKGEVMVQREKYGIRVTEITSRPDRIRSFGL
jgi:flagellar motor switch protein FliN